MVIFKKSSYHKRFDTVSPTWEKQVKWQIEQHQMVKGIKQLNWEVMLQKLVFKKTLRIQIATVTQHKTPLLASKK